MVELSVTTLALVSRLFVHTDQPRAIELLRDACADNLPLVHDPTPESLERIRFAALRASQGDLARLQQMVELAQVDWRDLLVTAGFAESTTEHAGWARMILIPDDREP